MSETTANLRRKIGGAGDLQSVVRTMKAVAAASIGLALWNQNLPQREQPLKVSLVPQMMLDSQGTPTLGAGVQVAGF